MCRYTLHIYRKNWLSCFISILFLSCYILHVLLCRLCILYFIIFFFKLFCYCSKLNVNFWSYTSTPNIFFSGLFYFRFFLLIIYTLHLFLTLIFLLCCICASCTSVYGSDYPPLHFWYGKHFILVRSFFFFSLTFLVVFIVHTEFIKYNLYSTYSSKFLLFYSHKLVVFDGARLCRNV